MSKLLNLIFIGLMLAGTFSIQIPAQAASMSDQLQAAGGTSGMGTPSDPRAIAMRVIRVALSFLGVIFIILIIYAGFLWMTAGGNEENAGKAKKLLFQAVVGLAIILSAYGITYLAFRIASGGASDGSDRTQFQFTL